MYYFLQVQKAFDFQLEMKEKFRKNRSKSMDVNLESHYDDQDPP